MGGPRWGEGSWALDAPEVRVEEAMSMDTKAEQSLGEPWPKHQSQSQMNPQAVWPVQRHPGYTATQPDF